MKCSVAVVGDVFGGRRTRDVRAGAGVEPATSARGGGRRTRDVRARGARFRRRRRARALRESIPAPNQFGISSGSVASAAIAERLEAADSGRAADRGGPTLGGGANASRGGGILRERAKLGRRRGTLSGGTLVGGRGVELGGDLKAAAKACERCQHSWGQLPTSSCLECAA